MEQDDKKIQEQGSEHKKDETVTKTMDEQEKTEHNKEADKIGKF